MLSGSRARPLILILILGVSLVSLHALRRPEAKVARMPLATFPLTIGPWHGENEYIDPAEIQAVGVTDYINRLYQTAGGLPVSLYIGYYASQRTGDTIHSPKNCLPGSGWAPLQDSILPIALGGGRVLRVNDYLVANENTQAVVLYWYQSRGRAIASEYAAKFWMAADAIERNRTDGALVRIWAPVVNGADQARAAAVSLTRAIDPMLPTFIPN